MERIRVVGIDLAGSENRETGVCILGGDLRAETTIVFKDDEIVSLVSAVGPEVVGIDAPLTLPKDRESIDDRRGGHFRECDLILRKLGIKFFPVTLGPMRILTKRGIGLRRKLERMGYKVIEVFPGGAQDVLGIPRKTRSVEGLKRGLARIGIVGIGENVTDDELDAVTAAYVALLYAQGEATVLEGSDGCIVMPPMGGRTVITLRDFPED